MPALSKSQRRLFGHALAFKRGKAPDAPPEVQELADSMTEDQILDYATTKEDELPEKKAADTGDVEKTARFITHWELEGWGLDPLEGNLRMHIVDDYPQADRGVWDTQLATIKQAVSSDSSMSREELLDQGSCCGQGCQNCPYEPRHEEGVTKTAATTLLDKIAMTPLTAKGPATTGGEAIREALAGLDLEALEAKHRAIIKTGPKSKRRDSVLALRAIDGVKRMGIRPDQMVVNQVPVIPPVFRPFGIVGDAFMPGDANELYRDLLKLSGSYAEVRDTFGEKSQQAIDSRRNLIQTARAVYGTDESPDPKTRSRVSGGFLRQVIGPNPKYSWMNRRMLSKPLDNVGSGVIIPDPEMGMDEVGIPEDGAWTSYAIRTQHRLVREHGLSPARALEAIKNRSEVGRRALEATMKNWPVVYVRSPAWHAQNAIAAIPRIVEGNAIKISPLIAHGQNADFDGDQMYFHVPATEEARKEAMERLLPSKMAFAAKNRDKIFPVPKHESIWSLYAANKRKGKVHKFATEAEAVAAIGQGKVSLSDDLDIEQMDTKFPTTADSTVGDEY